VERSGIEMAIQPFLCSVVFDRPEEGARSVYSMAGEAEIVLHQSLGGSVDGHEAHLVALALDPKVHHALSALHIAHAQPAEFFAADTVIEEGGQNGAIALTLERIFRRRLEQFAHLGVTERRRRAFIAVRRRPLDAIHRIAEDGVALAEIIE